MWYKLIIAMKAVELRNQITKVEIPSDRISPVGTLASCCLDPSIPVVFGELPLGAIRMI